MKKQIKLMADYHCWPLWWAGTHEPGNINPRTLTIHEDLAAKLDGWASEYDAQLVIDNPGSSKFSSDKELTAFSDKGIILWKRLIEQLSPDYEIWFFHPILRRVLKTPEKIGRIREQD